MAGKTLYDKLWESHVVSERPDGTALIYIDRQLLHEVTSPQAFEGLRLAGRKPWRLDANLATPDHNVPTTPAERQKGVDGIVDPVSKVQVQTLEENCRDFGIVRFGMQDQRQGIVHVIGPEQGATLPGMTIVCGDSHTSTHGAFGALAHGIGTSEVEHVLATQCLVQKKMKNMLIRVNGKVGPGVTAKDIILAIIGKIGTAGGTGYAVEFGGEAIQALSMEGRMTICNMAIEAGARAGLVAVDETTIAYVKDRPFAPKGEMFERAAEYWRTLKSDPDAKFDRVVELDASEIEPQVTWGNFSGDGCRCQQPRSGSGSGRGSHQARRHSSRPQVHGADGRTGYHRYQTRPGLYRFLHQLPHRGFARGSGSGQRQKSGADPEAGVGGAGFRSGKSPG